MPVATVEDVVIDFSRMDGGLNLSAKDPSELKANELQKAINAILGEKGFKRRPGRKGLSSAQTFTTLGKGMDHYLQIDGTSKLMALSDGKLEDVNKTTEVLTERFDLTGTGEMSSRTYLDKFWASNATEFVKVEDETSFKVGLPTMSGAAAAKLAGGSLPAATYNVRAAYYRKVSGTIVLYGKGENLGTVTTSAGDLSIRVSAIPDPVDLQVDGVAIFLQEISTDAAIFQYNSTDIANPGGYPATIDVTSNASRDTTIVFNVVSNPNNRPPGFTHIEIFDDRVWGADPTTKNRMRYSIRGNVFDLERYPAGNFIDLPYEITGYFVLGNFMYINTAAGIFRKDSDPFSKPLPINSPYHFLYINTVAKHGNIVIGLTNDGVRRFNGIDFDPVDLSRNVKPEIDKMINVTDDHRPAGIVFKRDIRTEYHLVYRDTNIVQTNTTNNRRLILDLDRVLIISASEFFAPWEQWDNGAEFLAIDNANTLFNFQSISGDSHINTEQSDNTNDLDVYDETGKLLTTATKTLVDVTTQRNVPNIQFRNRYELFRCFAQIQESLNVVITATDQTNVKANGLLSVAGLPKFGTAVFGTAVFPTEESRPFRIPLPRTLKGYSVEINFNNRADDINFYVSQLILEGLAEGSNFT